MLSISPSILASFEYWHELQPFGEEAAEDFERRAEEKLAELVSQIKGEPFEPSESMLLGRAWHEALERVGGADLNARDFEVDGYTFDTDSLRVITDKQPRELIRELSGELNLPEVDVVMKLRVDGIDGNTIHEVKTTTSSISQQKVEGYMNALQWRCYMLAFGAFTVVYHLCKLKRDRKTGMYSLAEYVPLRQYKHPNMRENVIRRVRECAEFIREQGLAQYREIQEEACA